MLEKILYSLRGRSQSPAMHYVNNLCLCPESEGAAQAPRLAGVKKIFLLMRSRGDVTPAQRLQHEVALSFAQHTPTRPRGWRWGGGRRGAEPHDRRCWR